MVVTTDVNLRSVVRSGFPNIYPDPPAPAHLKKLVSDYPTYQDLGEGVIGVIYSRWPGSTNPSWASTPWGSSRLLTSQNTIPRAKAAPANAAIKLGVIW